jgi:hypothetical protein
LKFRNERLALVVAGETEHESCGRLQYDADKRVNGPRTSERTNPASKGRTKVRRGRRRERVKTMDGSGKETTSAARQGQKG